MFSICFCTLQIKLKDTHLQRGQRVLHLLLGDLLQAGQFLHLRVEQLDFFAEPSDFVFGTFKFHLNASKLRINVYQYLF